ncbi:OprD family outer membrane porin [Sulfurospirillum deleyianum]|uniref:Outer membrane porin n=1 Tax=Sulfurospirillum deleyianum (strain ATCC 51133 / DSM 6946 / 5175) TaxID=525898 RepID=D1B0Z8_SULD5|nr:OprD family outer membrane porin [Sulfurospirillum deleyianum]ACZ11768.1 outer membrane porin [Sulfurospirillum deleyianum DSM 6946]
MTTTRSFSLSVLVASLVLGTQVWGANTLADAFKEGKVNGTIKSMYRDADISGQESRGFAMGGELGYVTGKLYGFGAGFTFQTSHTLGLKNNNLAEVDTSVATSKSDLSEAYLSYTFDKTLIKVGRQYIDTPLVSTSTSRMYNDIMEGATITNTSLSDTTLILGVISQYQYRFGDMENYDNNIYTLYARNKSVKGLDITLQGTTQEDERSLLFVDGAYMFPMNFPITIGTQYLGDYADIVGEKDSYLYGFMVGTKLGGISLSAYYNKTAKDGDVTYGYGQGTDWTYNSVQWLSGYTAGTESYQAKLSYDFEHVGIKGLSALTRYAIFNNSVDAGNDAKEWDIDVKYKFSGAMKGFETRLRYADISYNQLGKPNEHDFRFIANYNF